MNRRTLTSITRALPAWIVLCLLAAVSAAALLAACGDSGGGSSPTPTATVTMTATPAVSPSSAPSPSPSATTAASTALTLYFIRAGKLSVAERLVPHTAAPATAAVKELLKGPGVSERGAGLSTDVPRGVILRHVFVAEGMATVDLSSQFVMPASSDALRRRLAQLLYTVTRFADVRGLRLLIDGDLAREIPTVEGANLLLPDPLRRADSKGSLEPPIFVETPGVGAVLSSPFILEGTASVFEGSFTARLVDGAGHGIVRTQVQASAGAPERGRFRKTISFNTTAQSGTLIVYSQSMEDGSRQNEVRIPVRFSSD